MTWTRPEIKNLYHHDKKIADRKRGGRATSFSTRMNPTRHPRRGKWYYTTIINERYTLYLHEGQRIPRTGEAQEKRAMKKARIEGPFIYLLGRGRGGTVLKRKFNLELIQKERPTLKLNKKERDILALRVSGLERSKIARRLSGGRRRVSVTQGAVRGLLTRTYKKLERHDIGVIRNGKFIDFRVKQNPRKAA